MPAVSPEALPGLSGRWLRRLLPQASRDSETLAAVSANVSANLLGLGNAAHASGHPGRPAVWPRGCDGVASDELCLLVVLNTASIQLLPATIGLRPLRRRGGEPLRHPARGMAVLGPCR